eukprot:7582422-Pyramimonas_sp.AAC.1
MLGRFAISWELSGESVAFRGAVCCVVLCWTSGAFVGVCWSCMLTLGLADGAQGTFDAAVLGSSGRCRGNL